MVGRPEGYSKQNSYEMYCLTSMWSAFRCMNWIESSRLLCMEIAVVGLKVEVETSNENVKFDRGTLGIVLMVWYIRSQPKKMTTDAKLMAAQCVSKCPYHHIVLVVEASKQSTKGADTYARVRKK
eukprot:scaffold528_cov165-Amphora_coffeaeformis.AAC.48